MTSLVIPLSLMLACGKADGVSATASEDTAAGRDAGGAPGGGGAAGPGGDPGAGPGGPDEDTDTGGSTTGDTAPPRSGPDEAADPGSPEFPTVIDTLTVVLRTADAEYASTDGTVPAICLTDARCFELDNPDVDDFERGEVSTFYAYGVNLSREAVDQVTLSLSEGGADRWEPACLALHFDGEPAYCEDELGIFMGNEGGSELTTWTDPEGLHRSCGTCWDSPLTHGPMVGAVSPEGALLWARTDGSRSLTATLWEGGGPGDDAGTLAAWAWPEDDDDYTRTMALTGLLPDTGYSYQLAVDGVSEGPVGAFRTPPPAGTPGPLRIAFGSCASGAEQPIFSAVQAAGPDAFLFVGDNHYANSDQVERLRWYYQYGRRLPERAALLAVTPTLAVWDDHDFTGNNTDGAAPGRAVALQIFEEYWANPGYGTDAVPGVYSAWSWGDVDFFLLDDRYYRGLDGTLLGAAQTAWLLDGLAASEATFKVLVSGSQWTEHGTTDSWAAFPEARQALFDDMDLLGVEGVVLLSGDVHTAEFWWNLRPDSYDLPELTSSPLANPAAGCASAPEEQLSCFEDDNFFVTVDFDTAAAEPALEASIRDGTGASLYEWRITAAELSLAR